MVTYSLKYINQFLYMKLDILLPLKFNHPFTYESDLQTKLKKGDYVVVPFRNKNNGYCLGL